VSSSTKMRRKEQLGQRTTIGIGGSARYYAEPASVEDLRQVLSSAAGSNVPIFFLGRGSNLLIADGGFEGLVVRLDRSSWGSCEVLPANRMRVGAGLPLKTLCARAASDGLAGFEFLEGIPGTVGGALRM